VVGNGKNAGRDEGGSGGGRRRQERPCGGGTATQLGVQLCSTLEKTGVQVEHGTWVCLAARRAAQQQGNRTVGLSLLGQVIVDDEDVLTLVHPVLAQSCTGERCEPLEACGVGCRCGNDGGVVQRTVLFEGLTDRRDGPTLLTNRNVDAAHLLRWVAGLPVVTLVEDGVDADGGLARLTVTNDQLALTAANRRH